METFSFWSFSIPMAVLLGLMLDVELAQERNRSHMVLIPTTVVLLISMSID